MDKENILEVKGLHKRFTSKGVTVKAVTDVSFNVKPWPLPSDPFRPWTYSGNLPLTVL